MKVNEIISYLKELAPPEWAEQWDNPGLLVGRSDRTVTRVYVTLDVTEAAITKAREHGCEMIISHHPMIFSSVKQVNDQDFVGKRILEMIEAGISYYAMHTNFDVAQMADIVARQMAAEKTVPLEETVSEEKGIGFVGNLKEETSLGALAAGIKKQFELTDIRYYGEPAMEITRIAVCPGSGKNMAEAAVRKNAQVLITGDVDHHAGIDCVEKGLAVIDAGHFGLEKVFVPFMAQWCRRVLPELEVMTGTVIPPYHTV